MSKSAAVPANELPGGISAEAPEGSLKQFPSDTDPGPTFAPLPSQPGNALPNPLPNDHGSLLARLDQFEQQGGLQLPNYEALLQELWPGDDAEAVEGRACLLRYAKMTPGADQCSYGGYAIAAAYRTQLGLFLEPNGLPLEVRVACIQAVSYALATQLLFAAKDLLEGAIDAATAQRGKDSEHEVKVALNAAQALFGERLRKAVLVAAGGSSS